MKKLLLLIGMVVTLLLLPLVNFAQAPALGTTSSFALFTANGAFSNLGNSTVTGDVGTNAGAFTAFPPGILVGNKHVADPGSVTAAIDVAVAYSDLFSRTCGITLPTSTLGNSQILTPNVYCRGEASTLNGNLILDGQGDPTKIFIFKIGGALSTTTNSSITLINSASWCNVYWQIGGAFTLGANSVFMGTAIVDGAIHLLEGSALMGRGLSISGAIDAHNNVVSMPECNVSPCPVPTITGPAAVCETSTGNVYTTESGMTNYVWTVSGGTITSGGTSGSNTVTITWNTAGARTVGVKYTTNSCTTSPVVYNVTVATSLAPSITGPAVVCVNSTGNVYTTQSGMTNYVWSVPSGGTITAGGTSASNTVTVTWNTAGARTVGVNYSNASSCFEATPAVYNVTVNPCVSPCPQPTITGPAAVCVTSTGNVYTTEPGMTNYVWSVPSGGTITSGGTSGSNTVTVTWNTAGPQTVSVKYTTNDCTTTSTVYNVTVSTSLAPTIKGSDAVCENTCNVYTTEPGMSNYVWTVSSGGTITQGWETTVSTIVVCFGKAGHETVSVSYTNDNSCFVASPTVFNVTVSPSLVRSITGPATVCVNSTGNVYTTEPGMTNYEWTVLSGGTITSGGTSASNTVTITWNTAGARTVGVNYKADRCVTESSAVYNVTVNPCVGPCPVPTITGSDAVCENTCNVYTTEPGMTNYVWTVSSGGTITQGWETTVSTIVVCFNKTGHQTVSVNYTNPSGCTEASSSAVFNVTVSPSLVRSITGPATVCVASTGNVYTTETGMTNYEWTVPSGGTITSGGTSASNTVTITWNTAGARTVSVNYKADRCVTESPAVYNVTVNPCAIPCPAPTITGSDFVCESSCNVYTTEPGMTNYVWTVSSGGTITQGWETTVSTIVVCFNKTGHQTVSVNYTNASGCTEASSSAVFNVTVSPSLVRSITGPAIVFLASTGNVYTTEPGMTNYEWTVPSGGTITSGGKTASNTVTVTWNTAGEQTVGVNYKANTCAVESPAVYNVTVNPNLVEASFNVYPQPNDGHFTFSIQFPTDEIFDIEIFNMSGSKVYERRNIKLTGGKLEDQIDIRPLTHGFYSVVFRNGDHKVIRKILVNK
jgi:hypothetical protein